MPVLFRSSWYVLYLWPFVLVVVLVVVTVWLVMRARHTKGSAQASAKASERWNRHERLVWLDVRSKVFAKSGSMHSRHGGWVMWISVARVSDKQDLVLWPQSRYRHWTRQVPVNALKTGVVKLLIHHARTPSG